QQERADWSGIGLNLRSEQAVQQAQVSTIHRNYATVGKRVRKALIEVIGHLCFELDVGMDVEAHATAEAPKVCIVSMTQAHVVGVNANFSVILRKYGRRRA